MTKHTKTMTDEEAFERLLASHSKTQIARMIGKTKQAVGRWNEVPVRYVSIIHRETGIPKAELRPSDFA